MVVTDYGMSGLAITGLTGSGTPPSYLDIGSGSGTAITAQSGLIASLGLTRPLYTTRDPSTQKDVVFTFDYDSVTMSGLTFTEFGMYSVNTGGNIWDRHTLGSIAFDGTIELQVQITGRIG